MLTAIYIVGALALGFMTGLIFEYFIDAKIIRELQTENRHLRLLAEQMQTEKKAPQIIEINDNRAEPESYFVPF